MNVQQRFSIFRLTLETSALKSYYGGQITLKGSIMGDRWEISWFLAKIH